MGHHCWKELEPKDIMDTCKISFCITVVFIQCNTGSCCVHITGVFNIYLYGCVSLVVPVCPVCFCVVNVKLKSTSQNHVIHAKSCCIKHTEGARCELALSDD